MTLPTLRCREKPKPCYIIDGFVQPDGWRLLSSPQLELSAASGWSITAK